MKPRVIVLIIIMLFFPIFVNPLGSRAEYGVTLECQNNEHYTENEQYTFYQIEVRNTGDSNDTFILTRDSTPEDWQAQLSIQIISIPAQESRNVTLKVKPTCKCESGVKVYINVTATSQSDNNVFDTVQTITTYANVMVSLAKNSDYTQLERGESCTYEITVRNEGSENDSFRFKISQPQELSAVLDADYVTLMNNTSGTVNLAVTTLPFASYGYYELTIEAESLHNPQKSDVLSITTIIGKIELVAQNITLSNKHPNEGETITIILEILNNGTVNATDLIITLCYLTKDGLEIEIGSELSSIELGSTVKIQKDIEVSSNFTGILIEATINGKHKIWQYSLTKEELGLKVERSQNVPFYLIAIIVLLLMVMAIILLKLKKRIKE